MQPVERPRIFEELDHIGTLFEELQPSPGVLELAPLPAARMHQRHVEQERRYPLTLEQRQAQLARRVGQQAIDMVLDRPYHDLGGHAPGTFDELADNPFESVMEKSKPWMRDIKIAIDRYGAAELTVTAIESMTKSDRKTLALHFDGFMRRLSAAHRLIAAADGDVAAYPLLERRYGRRSHEEMINYLPALEELHDALQHSGVPQELHGIAHRVSPDPNRREEMRRRDDRAHGTPQVYFDGVKPRIERVAQK